MVRYLFDAQGGFLAGDDTLASYAYPSSTYATTARKRPAAMARQMVSAERRSGGVMIIRRTTDLRERNARWLAALAERGTVAEA